MSGEALTALDRQWADFGSALAGYRRRLVSEAWTLGGKLEALRAVTPRGEWTERLEAVGIARRTADRFRLLRKSYPDPAKLAETPSVDAALRQLEPAAGSAPEPWRLAWLRKPLFCPGVTRASTEAMGRSRLSYSRWVSCWHLDALDNQEAGLVLLRAGRPDLADQSAKRMFEALATASPRYYTEDALRLAEADRRKRAAK